MSRYFIIINLTRQQYISPHDFCESGKFRNIMGGLHGKAVGLLLLQNKEEPSAGNRSLPGSWAGDRIIITDDTSELYEQIMYKDGYENISYEALKMLCITGTEIPELVERAREYKPFLKTLFRIAHETGDKKLQHLLKGG